MKAASLLVGLFAILVPTLSALAGGTDTLSLLGMPKTEVLSRFGKPEKILGPEHGYQTYEYPDGLGIVIHDGKVVQYVAKGTSTYRTDKGIRIGSEAGDVTEAYGNYTATEDVEEWFGGRKQKVLYHHPKFNRYKINYAESDVIFVLDGDKKVESIWVGYIFPKE